MRTRSTAEVFDDHLAKRDRGEFEADLAANYAQDVCMLVAEGVFRGHDGVRTLHARLERDLPHAIYEYRARVVDGELALLEWTAHCDDEGFWVDDGVDSFVVRDGRITAQTIHYTVKARGPRPSRDRPG